MATSDRKTHTSSKQEVNNSNFVQKEQRKRFLPSDFQRFFIFF